MPLIKVRDECYQRIRDVMRIRTETYFRKYPERMDAERQALVIEIVRETLCVLEDYELSRREEE